MMKTVSVQSSRSEYITDILMDMRNVPIVKTIALRGREESGGDAMLDTARNCL